MIASFTLKTTRNDVMLQQIAFKAAGLINPIQIASDGRAAIDYLAFATSGDRLETHPLPCLASPDRECRLPAGALGRERLSGVNRSSSLGAFSPARRRRSQAVHGICASSSSPFETFTDSIERELRVCARASRKEDSTGD